MRMKRDRWMSYLGGRIQREEPPRKHRGFGLGHLHESKGIATVTEVRICGKVGSSVKTFKVQSVDGFPE